MIVLIALSGEITIKSRRVRKKFEDILIENIKRSLKVNNIYRDTGYLVIDTDDSIKKLSKVFGISYYAPSYLIKFNSLEDIAEYVKEKYRDKVKGKKFAIRAKRFGNHYFTSLDIAKKVGEYLYEYSDGVDLENPDIEIYVNVRNNKAYIYDQIYQGPKGLPVGVGGKCIVLFSGGFDSPVAAWMMMKRGCDVSLLNFSFGENVRKELIVKEAEILKEWNSNRNIEIYFLDANKILPYLSKVEDNYRVLIFKRIMYKTAEILAKNLGFKSIVTGESLSQVSSQTMQNLYITEYGINIPIFRPLIGFDKEEIIDLSRKIGTFEYSSKLPEYCALSIKSTTKGDLNKILEIENKLNINYDIILNKIEKIII